MSEAKVTVQVIYVDALGSEHIEIPSCENAETAIAYAKDPGNWPGHLVVRKTTTEDIYDNTEG